jgi:hypothetical protein
VLDIMLLPPLGEQLREVSLPVKVEVPYPRFFSAEVVINLGSRHRKLPKSSTGGVLGKAGCIGVSYHAAYIMAHNVDRLGDSKVLSEELVDVSRHLCLLVPVTGLG